MNRNEFETAFFEDSETGRNTRFGHIMLALARGPDWPTWAASPGTDPCYYNDVCFAALYWDFNRHPTRKRLIQIRDFAFPRNSADKGFMVNPALVGNGARDGFKAFCFSIARDWQFLKTNTSHQQSMVESGYEVANVWDSKEQKHDALAGKVRAIYSEMWLVGGSMRRYLTNVVGAMTNDQVIAAGAGSLLSALSNAQKKFWLESLINRFSGTSTTSAQYGQTYDVDDVGIMRNKFKNLLTGRVGIGRGRTPPGGGGGGGWVRGVYPGH